jgi:hypothetical protein
MDAPYQDPSRGRRRNAGLFARILRLIGTILFVAGVLLGAYAAFEWLKTGHTDAVLVEDVLLARLPELIRSWIAHPRSWHGLHRVAMWLLRIPVFATIGFGGFLILLASTASAGD